MSAVAALENLLDREARLVRHGPRLVTHDGVNVGTTPPVDRPDAEPAPIQAHPLPGLPRAATVGAEPLTVPRLVTMSAPTPEPTPASRIRNEATGRRSGRQAEPATAALLQATPTTTVPVARRGTPPDPARVSAWIVHLVIEVLSGRRPSLHLGRWLSPELNAQVAAGKFPASWAQGKAQVIRVRGSRIGDTAAELSVVVDDGHRVRATAVRLEVHRGRWRAVTLDVV